MRGYLIFGCILLCVVGFAQAQSFSKNPAPPGQQSAPPLVPGPHSITQNNNPGTIVAGSVACSPDNGNTTTANQYLRRFFLAADHGIVNQFDIDSVDLAVEAALNAGSITVNLYTIPNGATFLYGNMTPIGSMPAAVADQTLAFLNVAVTGSVADPVNQDLVVEVTSPDLSFAGRFFIGSNNLGQTQTAYLAATACGISEPTPTGSLGFPNMHVIMVVNGTEVPVELENFRAE